MNTLWFDLTLFAPELLLAVGTMALMLLGVFLKGGALRPIAILSVVLWLAVGFYLWVGGAQHDASRAFSEMLIADGFGQGSPHTSL